MLKMAIQTHERLMTIRFEDLLKSEQAIADIFKFVGIPTKPVGIPTDPKQGNGKSELGKFWWEPNMSKEEMAAHMAKMNHYDANFTRRELDAFETNECKEMLRAWDYDALGVHSER